MYNMLQVRTHFMGNSIQHYTHVNKPFMQAHAANLYGLQQKGVQCSLKIYLQKSNHIDNLYLQYTRPAVYQYNRTSDEWHTVVMTTKHQITEG